MAYRYRTVKINGRTKLLHRHLMELRLGRTLSEDEHVHRQNSAGFACFWRSSAGMTG